MKLIESKLILILRMPSIKLFIDGSCISQSCCSKNSKICLMFILKLVAMVLPYISSYSETQAKGVVQIWNMGMVLWQMI